MLGCVGGPVNYPKEEWRGGRTYLISYVEVCREQKCVMWRVEYNMMMYCMWTMFNTIDNFESPNSVNSKFNHRSTLKMWPCQVMTSRRWPLIQLENTEYPTPLISSLSSILNTLPPFCWFTTMPLVLKNLFKMMKLSILFLTKCWM